MSISPIVRLTTPPLKVLRRFIPSISGQDTASIVLCLILIYVKFLIIRMLDISHVPISNYMAPVGAASYGGLIVFAIADLIALTFTVFLGAIIIQVILSWISPGQYNPLIGLVHKIAELDVPNIPALEFDGQRVTAMNSLEHFARLAKRLG